MNRAYAIIEVKNLDEGKRTFSGWATTPETDRVGDIINPLGASFKNPLVLLHQHDADRPIGSVKFKKPTKNGIEFEAEIPVIKEAGALKDRVDTAWGEIKNKLVRAVSIGFRPLKYAFMDAGGIDFQEIEIYELSTVSVPANAGALITSVGKSLTPEAVAVIKKFDTGASAATGMSLRPSNANPPATGKSIKPISIRPQEGQRNMSKIKNVGAQIAALEEQRTAKIAAMEAIHEKASGENRTKNAEEREQFDALRDARKTLDTEIADLKDLEEVYQPSAKPVETKANDPAAPRYERMTPVVKKQEEKGLAFARLVKAKAVAKMDGMSRAEAAEKMYGRESETYHVITKSNEVNPGTNISGNWAADLVSSEGAVAADFAEFLRPATLIGKFGQGNVPALRNVPFRKPLIIGTGGGTGYWVGEGKPKPMTSFDFDRSTLDPLKCATIAVLSKENIRDSSPGSDGIIRDELRRALVQLQDVAFIDPTNAGTSNVKPASVLNGTYAIPATTYTDQDDVRTDIRELLQVFINQNNPANQAVLVMEEGSALAAGLITNALGQPAFSDINMRGGTLLGIPVITSESVPSGIVGIVNASDIFFGDDGDITVDMSTEASLEMKSVPTQDATAPGTGASLVSLWQSNLVGFLAERTVNWKRRRPRAAAYLTGVAWGGTINIS